MIKHIIFDFDGTLVDSEQVILTTWNTLAKQYNFKIVDPNEVESMKKMSLREKSRYLNFPLYKVPIFAPKLYQLYQNSLQDIKLFAGIKDLLQELKARGYKVTIISSNSRDVILSFLKRNQITSIKDVICSSSLLGKDKLIMRYLRENRLHSSEVIYIGDEQRDILACKKVGVKIIWVGWGLDSIELIKNMQPDYQVFKPSEILNIV